MPQGAQIQDGATFAAVETRFREDLWRTVPADAVAEAEVKWRQFGPVQATVFGELPRTAAMNLAQGAAEPGAIEDGHLARAIEWLRSYEVDYRVSVALDRPDARAAEDWLGSRGFERGPSVRRYTRPLPAELESLPNRVTIRELDASSTEGMGHIAVESFGLPGLTSVLLLGLPDRPGWRCYSASVEGQESACGSLLVLDRLALLSLDATLPEARRSGCQTTLIKRRLNDAHAAGCDTALAEVCEDQPCAPVASLNLERAGFTEVPGLVSWQRPTGVAK